MSTAIHLPIQQPPAREPEAGVVCIALVGNPNAGKTTLFNALTGLRAKTANFPGTTIEHRTARATLTGRTIELIDLPGLYSLAAATSEEKVARDVLLGQAPGVTKPTGVVLLLDATNLERNLFLASQVLEMGLPTVVALNMIDLARKKHIRIDPQALGRELGCPVVPVSARNGEGIDSLRAHIALLADPAAGARRACPPGCASCQGCQFEARYDWAEAVGRRVIASPRMTHGRKTEAVDRFLTHPTVGLLAFLGVMLTVFAMIFWIASYPMAGIEWLFASTGGMVAQALESVAAQLPAGAWQTFVREDVRSLLVEGVLGGVGGVLVFLPQICILFFFLSLLEDTGYLARAAFVMDRLMRRVGLPGKAFVPMLSAHACAVPAIMAARVIDDRRDRLVTILILPLLTCSARIPVYAMIVALLFPQSSLLASLVFTGAYLLGIIACLGMAWCFKKTLLRGETKPLVLELPSYKMPSISTAVLTMFDRAMIFVRKAGTVILVVSILLWALAHYPKSDPPAPAVALQQQATQLVQPVDGQGISAEARSKADELNHQADDLIAQHALAHSFAGRVGHFIEPVIRPLGFDWQIGIGLLSSFAAREVFVSTLAVVYGVGADAADDNPQRLYDTVRQATRSDGSLVFTTATSVSVLIFYVLAMQCMSTLAVTRRETGSWRWPIFQFAYMSGLAYGCAFVAYTLLHVYGIA